MIPPTQPPVQWLPGLLPRDKTAESAIDHQSLSIALVRGLELYLYSPSEPSDPALEWTLPLPLLLLTDSVLTHALDMVTVDLVILEPLYIN